MDGGAVRVGLVVELGLNNCHTHASFSCEPGNTGTMVNVHLSYQYIVCISKGGFKLVPNVLKLDGIFFKVGWCVVWVVKCEWWSVGGVEWGWGCV